MKRITIIGALIACVAIIGTLSINATTATTLEMEPLAFNEMQDMVGGCPGPEYQSGGCPNYFGYRCPLEYSVCYCTDTFLTICTEIKRSACQHPFCEALYVDYCSD